MYFLSSVQRFDLTHSCAVRLIAAATVFAVFQLMECCVNALVTSFKETILAECQGMIKRNETESR